MKATEAVGPERTVRSRAATLESSARRVLAAYVDVALIPFVVGATPRVAVGGLARPTELGALLILPLLVAAEVRRGRTPGKALLRLEVRDPTGGRPGWGAATRRRAWMGVYALAVIPGLPAGLAVTVTLLVVGSVLVSVLRADDGRGWHDRWAATEVVAAPQRARPRAVTIAGAVAAALVVLGVAWWLDPEPPSRSSGFSALPDDVEALKCRVTHVGWPYPTRDEAVILGPGERFSDRVGPHDVALAFTDERRDRPAGFEEVVVSRSLGYVRGDASGLGSRFERITTGPGLGELTIRCQPTNAEARR